MIIKSWFCWTSRTRPRDLLLQKVEFCSSKTPLKIGKEPVPQMEIHLPTIDVQLNVGINTLPETFAVRTWTSAGSQREISSSNQKKSGVKCRFEMALFLGGHVHVQAGKSCFCSLHNFPQKTSPQKAYHFIEWNGGCLGRFALFCLYDQGPDQQRHHQIDKAHLAPSFSWLAHGS